jgi:hypothetical protein
MRHSIRDFFDSAAATPWLRNGQNAEPSKIELALSHKVPKMPLMIDEQETDLRAVHEFRGQTLVTVADGDALEGRMLHVFTSMKPAQDYLRAEESASGKNTSSSSAGSPGFTSGPPPFGGFQELYDLDGLDGCYWRLYEGVDNLTFNYSTKWACGFLFFGWITADNNVSSIDCYVSADQVHMFSLPNLMGSVLIATGNFRINSLAALGWDNRISSQRAVYL